MRARRIQGGRGDTVVKLRPAVPSDLPADVRRSAGFNVEVDIMPGGFVCSASSKGRCTAADVSDAVERRSALHKLFSKEQRAFYAQHAPAGIVLDDLTPLGPTFVLKAAFPAPVSAMSGVAPRRLVAEAWFYPDGSRVLELSTKCLPSETFQTGNELRAYLIGLGIPISENQQAKTRTALDFFRADLQAEAGQRA